MRHSEHPTLSVCICTADRPQLLRRCLESIADGEAQPDEVVVSDDSADPSETHAVCEDFGFVSYVPGPRRGLFANLNNVVAVARCDYVSLLDDDALLSPAFVRLARQITATADLHTLITGSIIEKDRFSGAPGTPTFLGHYHETPRGPIQSVHSNCNLIPRAAFSHASFDELLAYGYDEVDLCAQLLAVGYRIEHRPELVNQHAPPRTSRDSCLEQTVRARFYVTLKRHLIYRPNRFLLVAYVVIAILHEAAYRAIHRRKGSPFRVIGHMHWALRAALRQRARHAPAHALA